MRAPSGLVLRCLEHARLGGYLRECVGSPERHTYVCMHTKTHSLERGVGGGIAGFLGACTPRTKVQVWKSRKLVCGFVVVISQLDIRVRFRSDP